MEARAIALSIRDELAAAKGEPGQIARDAWKVGRHDEISLQARRAAVEASVRADERAEYLQLLTMTDQEIRLGMGELSAQEMRAVGSMLDRLVATIRNLGKKPKRMKIAPPKRGP